MIILEELVNLIYNILVIPIPMPISFEKVYYYNLFGLLVVVFFIFIISLVIRKLYAGAGDN